MFFYTAAFLQTRIYGFFGYLIGIADRTEVEFPESFRKERPCLMSAELPSSDLNVRKDTVQVLPASVVLGDDGVFPAQLVTLNLSIRARNSSAVSRERPYLLTSVSMVDLTVSVITRSSPVNLMSASNVRSIVLLKVENLYVMPVTVIRYLPPSKEDPIMVIIIP